MKTKILILHLIDKKTIEDFENQYQELMEQGYQVENTWEKNTSIIFHMEKWT